MGCSETVVPARRDRLDLPLQILPLIELLESGRIEVLAD